MTGLHCLEEELRRVAIDRDHEIHGIILALLAEQHWIAVGEPGEGKSYLVDQVIKRIGGLEQNDYFKTQLFSYTTDREVLGAVSLESIKQGRMIRVTDGMFPVCKYANIDEIYKANSGLINCFLGSMEEREFRDGDKMVKVNLQVMFATANEIPQDELAAHWDRFLLRFNTQPIRGVELREELLALEVPENPEKVVNQSEIEAARMEVKDVEISASIRRELVSLAHRLAGEGIKVSDRRLRASLKILKAEAWYNGRSEVTLEDFTPLRYVLWTYPEDIDKVQFALLGVNRPNTQKTYLELSILEAAYSQLRNDVADMVDDRVFTNAIRFFMGKMTLAKNNIKKHKEAAEQSGEPVRPMIDALERLSDIKNELQSSVQDRAKARMG